MYKNRILISIAPLLPNIDCITNDLAYHFGPLNSQV